MKALGIALLTLLIPAEAGAGADPCSRIEEEFSVVERLDFPRCADADHTKTRYSLRMPEILRGCRELASFDTSLGLSTYRDRSRRFREHAGFELLASPADDKEFDPADVNDHICRGELGPLLRFRKLALEELIRLDDEMENKMQAKPPGGLP